jgi:hypothetical protein
MAVDLEHRTRINAPPGVMFNLCLDINARVESMSKPRERAITRVTTGRIASTRR